MILVCFLLLDRYSGISGYLSRRSGVRCNVLLIACTVINFTSGQMKTLSESRCIAYNILFPLSSRFWLEPFERICRRWILYDHLPNISSKILLTSLSKISNSFAVSLTILLKNLMTLLDNSLWQFWRTLIVANWTFSSWNLIWWVFSFPWDFSQTTNHFFTCKYSTVYHLAIFHIS